MKRQHSVAKAAQRAFLWICTFAVAVGALAFSWYVHLNASDWEPLLIGVGVLVAIGGFFGWRRGPKHLRWTAAGLGWFGIISATIFAYDHGWSFVAEAIVVMAVLAITSPEISRLRRTVGTLMQEASPVPPELVLEARQPIVPNPHDDMSAEKVYLDKRRLVRVVLSGLGGCALFGGAAYLIYRNAELPTDSALATLGGGFLCAVLAVPTLNALLLLANTRPVVFISEAGIRKRGLALVRWREIVGMSIGGLVARSPGSRGVNCA